MPALTEAWWVCTKCKAPVVRTKSGKVMEGMREHRKACDPLACFNIRLVSQADVVEWQTHRV